MKHYVLLLCCSLITIVSSAHCQQDNKSAQDSTTISIIERERLMLKNAAFCTCLYKSFPVSDSVFVNEGSGAAYLELGRHSIDAYTRIFDFAGEYARRKYSSKYDRSLSVMKCLDFYNSKELDDLIRSLDSEIDVKEEIEEK